MKTIYCVALAVCATASPSQNKTPGVGMFNDYAYEFHPFKWEGFDWAEDAYEKHVGGVTGQNYRYFSYQESRRIGTHNPQTCTIAKFHDLISTHQDLLGTFQIDTHGNSGHIAIEAFEPTPAGMAARDARHAAYLAGTNGLPKLRAADLVIGWNPNKWYWIGVTDQFIRRYGKLGQSIVYVNACVGGSLTDDFVAANARVAVGNPACPTFPEVRRRVETLWKRMNGHGQNGVADRPLNAAIAGTQLTVNGVQETTLSPAVVKVVAPCPLRSGAKVEFHLDTDCYLHDVPDIRGAGCKIEDERWLSSTVLEGTCKGPLLDTYLYALRLDYTKTRSEKNHAKLDGNTDPVKRPRKNAFGPSHDHYFIDVKCTASWSGAALSDQTGLMIDVKSPTGNDNAHGVCRTVVDGEERFWVSARAFAANQPHLLYEFDRQGQLLGTHDQPIVWDMFHRNGIRGLTTDGRYVYGAGDVTAQQAWVFAFDVVTRQWDSSRTIHTRLPFTGVSALVYRPDTDTFWAANLGSVAYEFDRAGNLVGTHDTGATKLAGAGYDAGTQQFFWFDQAGTRKPPSGINQASGVNGMGFDAATGQPNGIRFFGDLGIPNRTGPQGGLAGGMDVYRLPDGLLYGVCLAQASTDVIYELALDFEFGTTCNGTSGSPPSIGIQGEPFTGNPGLSITLGDVEGAVQASLFLGFNQSQWQGFALPFDLGLVNLPNCNVNVALDIEVATTEIWSGGAAVDIRLPRIPGAMSLNTFWQWVVIDPGANAFGITTSTGGAVRVTN